VFTARYALSPYIKQIRCAFKGLMPAHMALNWLWHLCPRLIQNQHINFPFGLRSRCSDWSAAAGPVISVLSTALKTTDSGSNWANVCGIIATHASQTSLNFNRAASFRNKKFIHHSWPSTHVHIIRHFALLLWWTRVADWTTNNRCGAGQCRYPVSKARNFTRRHV
jgi:hypothetical protein